MTDTQYIELLSRRLQEADDVLEAIRNGSVDALFIQGEQGETVYTLDNADKPYRLLVEQMQEGAVSISADGTILYANQRFSEIIGAPLEQIFGCVFQDYLCTGDAERFSAYLSADADKAIRCAASFSRPDQSVFPGYLSFNKLPDDFSGEAIFCGVITDLTDQKLMEARLHQSQKMEALGQLTGGLAHDFNNLLQAIQGSFDLIIRRPDSEKVTRWAESGLRVADRGAKLTSQLLAFSRSQKLELKVCSVNAVIHGMSDLLTTTLGQGVRLVFELDVTDPYVLTDPVQLELAILNLAINGRDAMGGSGQLVIGTRQVASHAFLTSPSGFLEVRVVDNGTGMSEQTRLNAFNPFFTTKDVGQGTGLGLSQVESIVQQSSGAVSIESALGRGTRVCLAFPCVDEARVPEEHPHPAMADAPVDLKILVVDDDDEVRRTLVDMLDMLGHQVVEAASGPAGLAAIGQQPFDLVMLDFAMPGMNGAQVAQEIHRLDASRPIVFVSGYSDTDQLRPVMNHHTALLRKPFTLDGLKATLQGMLQR
jgi:PAS domain S-box-containing protein